MGVNLSARARIRAPANPEAQALGWTWIFDYAMIAKHDFEP
jgi:hypothetical protein